MSSKTGPHRRGAEVQPGLECRRNAESGAVMRTLVSGQKRPGPSAGCSSAW
ncbi:hypothetical protein ACFFX0_02195 [Citricoccus parietis]|uniref:Uncharacterized protein n=1 Tax=Citricoccus parietis TaxID=592307 RepID=A0ABV5FTP9_9MICC